MTLPLWKKLWLLFTVIWVIVAGLNAATIVAFAEGAERGKALQPAILAVAVPALVYAFLWGWQRFISRKPAPPPAK